MAYKANERVPLNLNQELKDMKINKAFQSKNKLKNSLTSAKFTQPNKNLLPTKSPKQCSFTKLMEFYTLEDQQKHCQSSNDFHIPSPIYPLSLKAESPTKLEKAIAQDNFSMLKCQLETEKVKYINLQHSYDELLEMFTQNEIYYKERLSQLQSRLSLYESVDYVTRPEFTKLCEKVAFLESLLSNN
jgi:hypothetical protein